MTFFGLVRLVGASMVLVALTPPASAAPPTHCPEMIEAYVTVPDVYTGPLMFAWDDTRFLYFSKFLDGEWRIFSTTVDGSSVEGGFWDGGDVKTISVLPADWSGGPIGHPLTVDVSPVGHIVPVKCDYGYGWHWQRICVLIVWGFAAAAAVEGFAQGIGWWFRGSARASAQAFQ